MDFSKLLGLRPGVTAVIGSGGKTSLLRRLAEELPGSVLLCTTTHIRPFEEYPLLTAPTPEDIRKALTTRRILCLGTPCENGKLTAPSLSVETLATPIRESVHRPEQFCTLTGTAKSAPASPEQAAAVLLTEKLCNTVFLNQIDTEAQRPLADRFAAALGGSGLRIVAGSLRAGIGWLYPDI